MPNKRVTLDELRVMARAAKNKIDHIYLHWTAGHYHQFPTDYHLCIDSDGAIIATTDDLAELKSHTWRRNSDAIGIAMCCCYGAVAYSEDNIDYGEEPPTPEQIYSMAQVVAVLCDELGLEINSDIVMTHCEAAEIDGYGPYGSDPDMRWDLWVLPDVPGDGQMKPGGDVIRGKAIWHLHHGL